MRTRRQRVLFTIGSAQRGGAEGQLVQVAAGLARRGHDVRVVFLVAAGELTAVLDAAGVPWSVARPPVRHISRVGRDLLMIGRLAYWLVTWRPTVVMAWLPGAIWPTLLVSRAVSRARRIAALRGGTFVESKPVLALLRSAVSHADVVTVNSPHLMEEVELLHGHGERVRFVPNAVTIPDEPAADVGRQPPTAVVVANYRWYKGHDVLMQALSSVDVPVHVRLLGEGAGLEETRALAAQLGVADKVTFVPYPPDVPVELAGAQFAIHPSRTEGLSNAILEELAAGLPVVAAEVGGNPLLVEDGVHGFLVPPGDAGALAVAVQKLATEPEARRQMGSAAREHARDFSWTACLDRYESLFFGSAETPQ